MKQKKIKVFIGLVEVAGYFRSLNDGFHDIGIKSCFFQYFHNKYYNYGSPFMLFCQYLSSLKSSYKIFNLFYRTINNFIKLLIFIYTLFFYNVYIFGALSTFLNYNDLKLLKFFKKKIIYVFLGSDSRPDYLNGALVNNLYLNKGKVIEIDKCIKNVLQRKKIITKIEKYANHCINHPPCAMFHNKQYIKWLYIGYPFSKNKLNVYASPKNIDNKNAKTIILHAPSNPETKGTKYFREIMNKLINEGINIDFIEIINQSNSKVLELLTQCDFVVDELYSDTPLGGLGVEAAFLGKTTIKAGYYNNYILNDYNNDVIPPSIFCEPHDIEEKIRLLIADSVYCKKMGIDALNFVNNNWLPVHVASRFIKLINNDVPREWIGNPYKLNYVFGYGQSKKQLKKIIMALKVKGNEVFAINDKPKLLEMLLNI